MNSAKFKRIFRNLVLATAKHEERKLARAQIKKQISKIRKVSLENYPPKKDVVDKEITKLEKQIEDLLEKEKLIIAAQQNENATIKKMQEKIDLLTEKLEKMTAALAIATETQPILPMTPPPIQKRIVPQEHIDILQKNLELLEKKHEILKQSKQFKPEELARIEEKINSLKEKLVMIH